MVTDTELVDFKSSPEPTTSSSPSPARIHDPAAGDIQISLNFTIPGSRVVRGQLRAVRRILLATLVVTVLGLVSAFLRVLALVLRNVVAKVIRHWLVRTLIFLAIVFWPSDAVNRLAAAPELAPVIAFFRERRGGLGGRRQPAGVRVE